MLSCDRTRCPMDVFMWQDTLRCPVDVVNGHVTGHVVLWMLSCDRTRCPVDVVMWQDTLSCGCFHVTGHSPPLFFLWEKYVVLCMLSCDRRRCPVDVVMSQDTPPCFIMSKICCPMDVVMWQDTLSLSYRCFHVTGHFPPVLLWEKYVALWMLSCHRTLPPCFIMGKICCPMDAVMWQDTLSCGCCHVTGHSPLVLLLLKTWFTHFTVLLEIVLLCKRKVSSNFNSKK